MYLTTEKIYAETNGGLDIILNYYPDANNSATDPRKKFKRRDEKTASASLKKTKEGTWIVTDFGAFSKGKNAIDVVILEENCDFKEAIQIIAEKFKIKSESGPMPEAKENKPLFEKRAAKASEKDGEYYFKEKLFSPEDLAVLGPHVTKEVCEKYDLKCIASYVYVKDGKALKFSSTPEYPIFLFDFEDWKKMYRPMEAKKEYRFLYIGTKPKDFVFGLKQIEAEFRRLQKIADNSAGNDADENAPADNEKKSEKYKIENIILASGDRDALNVASLGFLPLWLNSETADLSFDQYKRIRNKCKNFFNIPDIDETGLREGRKIALRFLDIKTIILPEELKSKKDFRGNPCKDFTDYIKHYSKEHFTRLVSHALPLKFWDEVAEFDRNGKFKGIKYVFNNVTAYEFLNANGYYTYDSKKDKNGYTFVQAQNKIVNEIKTTDIKAFVDNYLKDLHFNVDLRNMVYRTTQLNDASLARLMRRTFDFKDFDKDFQYMFFKNKTWKITAEGVEEMDSNNISKFVWGEEVIDFNVKKSDPLFDIKFNEETGKFALNILKPDFAWTKFIYNTGRVHWKKETEDKEELTDDEKYEQDLHFINKCYSLGYLLHRYKNPSRPWAVYAMDTKDSAVGESNGGSGKSIFLKTPRRFMRSKSLNGRDRHLTDNTHLFHGVDENTDYILIDDADRYLNLHFFFPMLTGEMPVNPKFDAPYELAYEDSPHFAFSTNFTPSNLDASLERRLLYIAFSDYYHKKDNKGFYKREWTPELDFGKLMFTDWSPEEWSLYYNFVANCLSFYLRHGDKIEPPMEKIIQRNLRAEMGDTFMEWANDYFADESRFNCNIEKKTMYDSYRDHSGNEKTTAQKFKKQLTAFCHYKDYTLNPPELITDKEGNRIITRDDNGKNKEALYIRNTPPEAESNRKDDLPF